MLVDVFRSNRKSDTYLYLPRGADFSALPELLQKTFGQPELALSLQLTPERQLARHEASEVLDALARMAFFCNCRHYPQPPRQRKPHVDQ